MDMSQPLQFLCGSILAVHAACIAAMLFICFTGRNPFE
jgi:hypothetical protein